VNTLFNASIIPEKTLEPPREESINKKVEIVDHVHGNF
jgi:hypothetical protein